MLWLFLAEKLYISQKEFEALYLKRKNLDFEIRAFLYSLFCKTCSFPMYKKVGGNFRLKLIKVVHLLIDL